VIWSLPRRVGRRLRVAITPPLGVIGPVALADNNVVDSVRRVRRRRSRAHCIPARLLPLPARVRGVSLRPPGERPLDCMEDIRGVAAMGPDDLGDENLHEARCDRRARRRRWRRPRPTSGTPRRRTARDTHLPTFASAARRNRGWRHHGGTRCEMLSRAMSEHAWRFELSAGSMSIVRAPRLRSPTPTARSSRGIQARCRRRGHDLVRSLRR